MNRKATIEAQRKARWDTLRREKVLARIRYRSFFRAAEVRPGGATAGDIRCLELLAGELAQAYGAWECRMP